MSGFLTGAGAVFKFLVQVFSPARCLLSELLLFQELQTFVSVVASARLYRGMPVRRRCFTEAAVLAASSEKLEKNMHFCRSWRTLQNELRSLRSASIQPIMDRPNYWVRLSASLPPTTPPSAPSVVMNCLRSCFNCRCKI